MVKEQRKRDWGNWMKWNLSQRIAGKASCVHSRIQGRSTPEGRRSDISPSAGKSETMVTGGARRSCVLPSSMANGT